MSWSSLSVTVKIKRYSRQRFSSSDCHTSKTLWGISRFPGASNILLCTQGTSIYISNSNLWWGCCGTNDSLYSRKIWVAFCKFLREMLSHWGSPEGSGELQIKTEVDSLVILPDLSTGVSTFSVSMCRVNSLLWKLCLAISFKGSSKNLCNIMYSSNIQDRGYQTIQSACKKYLQSYMEWIGQPHLEGPSRSGRCYCLAPEGSPEGHQSSPCSERLSSWSAQFLGLL